MASTEGLVPITRKFLSSYYDKYPFTPLSDDVSRLPSQMRSVISDWHQGSSLSEGEILLVEELDRQPPHKLDENMWKNRENIEEILFLLERSHWPSQLQQQSSSGDNDLVSVLEQLKDTFQHTLKFLESFQAKNSDNVFNTVMTYMPQDFRGTIIRQQRERSERNKQAEVDALINSGGSIRDRYALLWKQQMDRRRQLAQLGSATGVYKTLVKYLVGVPDVLLDFVRKINDDEGPMEEQRQRYGPYMYSLTKMALSTRVFLYFYLKQFEAGQLTGSPLDILKQATAVYTFELQRFIEFMSEVFINSPFFITAEEAGSMDPSNGEEYKEINLPAGKSHEVSITVDQVNSYIAWDFSLVQGKLNLDIGFSVECTNPSGDKTMILPYRRYESDQGNFCTCVAGNYTFIWDNTYSNFFKKVLRYKVDCIPPDVEPVQSVTEAEA